MSSLQQTDLIAWHARFCRPDRTVLSIVGDLDAGRVEELARKTMENLEAAGDAQPLAIPPSEPSLPEDKTYEKQTEKGQTAIVLGYPGLPMDAKDRHVLDVIDAVTSGIGLPSGRLHDALRGEGQGLAYYVHAINWMGLGQGCFYILTRCSPEKEREVIARLHEVMRQLAVEEISDEELERGKRMCITSREIELQTNAAQAQEYALNEAIGLGFDFGDDTDRGIVAVTKADVQRLAKSLFGRSVLAVVHGKEKPKLH